MLTVFLLELVVMPRRPAIHLFVLLLPVLAGAQEPRVRAVPVGERPSDYWVDLEDVPRVSAVPVKERRITPVKTPA